MKIDSEKCTGCSMCVKWCPCGAMFVVDRKVRIDWDECTECGVCRRVNACPVGAIYQQPLEWPRSVRAVYSDPLNIHKETGLAGRGTEETKTNDVTNRFKRGEIGIAIEVGRPKVGAKLRELERFSIALAEKGIAFEPCNPLTKLIDATTGKLPVEILDEKVISAIIEFTVPEKEFISTLNLIKEVAQNSKTVISVDAAVRAAEDGSWPTIRYLDEAGYYYRPNCKTNVGLGKLLPSKEA